MKYKFPKILHLNEVKNVVDGVDGFCISEKEYGYVINYVSLGTQIFPDIIEGSDDYHNNIIRRECRGIMFDLDGYVISRPLHKFFNVNEREETQISKIDLFKPHVILEKLDGSLIRTIPLQDGYRLGTKAGITDISMQAEVFVSENQNYHELISALVKLKITPMFEWCSRKQRIVIDYPKDRLVFIAARYLKSGEYISYDQIIQWGREFNVDVVRQYPGTVTSMENLVAETRELKGQEGWVIRWSDGHCAKIKADEYISIHKAKDSILREKNLINLLISGTIDDVKPYLLESDKDNVERYETLFWQGLNNTSREWNDLYVMIRQKYKNDRKAFAIEMAPSLSNGAKRAIFKAWTDNSIDFMQYLLEFIKENISSQPRVDSIRHLWGNHSYNINQYDE